MVNILQKHVHRQQPAVDAFLQAIKLILRN